MKQTFVLIAAAIIGFSTPVLAQSDDNETEITVYNRQFPEFAVVYLSGTGQYDSQPHGTLGIRPHCAPVALCSLLY